MLYLIVAKSASGKDYITDKICKDFNKEKTISRTTRQPRYKGENTHKFITFEQSEKEFNREDVVAKTVFADNRYYTLKEDIKDFYIVDVNGIKSFKNYDGDKTVIYLKIPSYKRIYRIIKRDGFIKGIKRLVNDIGEFTEAKSMADIVCTPEKLYNMFKEGILK